MENQTNFIVHSYQILDMAEYVEAAHQKIFPFSLKPEEPLITFDEAEALLYGRGLDSCDRLDVLLDLIDRLPDDAIGKLKILRDGWISSDNVYNRSADFVSIIKSVSKNQDGSIRYAEYKNILSSEEKVWIDGLGDCFQVYRGCDNDKIAGVSWTTDHNVAQNYAYGNRSDYNDDPVVVTATCCIFDVLLATNAEKESEIIVNPEFLSNVKVERIPTH